MKTYSPLPNSKFKLAPETVARERKIHELQVLYGGVSLAEKKQICDMQKWKYEERIPELRGDVRVSVDALAKMVERNYEKPRQTHTDLQNIIERHKDDYEEPAEAITTAEYWLGVAAALFEDFDATKVDADELNFKVIQEAYADFFGLQ